MEHISFFLFFFCKSPYYNVSTYYTTVRSIVHVSNASCSMFTLSPLSNAASRYSNVPLFPFQIPSVYIIKYREIKRGKKEFAKKIGRVTRATRGDRNFRWIRRVRGEAREMVLLLVFIRGATEISALQLTRAISGGKIFQRLSTSARVHVVQRGPICFATGSRHPCQT